MMNDIKEEVSVDFSNTPSEEISKNNENPEEIKKYIIKEIEIEIFPDGRLNTSNAAKYIGMSTTSLNLLRHHGKGPEFVKTGRVFYYKDKLDLWINKGGNFTCSKKNKKNEHNKESAQKTSDSKN